MSSGESNLIHVLLEGGQQQAYEEVRVHDLLARQVLTPETYFWKEGMADWRPLSELPPPSGYAIVPPRRTGNPDPSTASPVSSYPSFQSTAAPVALPVQAAAFKFETSSPSPDRVRRKLSRHSYFRTNPLPLTICLQILLVLSIGLTSFFIYYCYGKIHSVGSLSLEERRYLLNGGVTLICVHTVIEIMFFFWLYYTNRNCHVFSGNMHFMPGWAVGWFFVPIFNLFRPYQVLQEIWKVSENPRSWHGRRDSIFVGCWFLFRLSIGILGRGPFHTEFSDSTDPGVNIKGILIYFATLEANILLIEVTTLILISVITWRQVQWIRQNDD